MSIKGVIERYREYLPVSEKTPVITLCEGNTALIRAKALEDRFKIDAEIFLKYEGQNPTGSFKDRGMTMAVSKAKEDGIEAVMCASTGNTSASASAYAVRAGMKSFVVIPEGNIALGKLAQALIHGACVIAIKGNFDKALSLVKEITDEYPVVLVNSLNPFRIEGQKTGAFEICDDLREAPDLHFIPVGNAGNITAYWKGYKEYKEAGKIVNLPRMMGFQAAGAAPIVEKRIIERPETIATAIRIGNPASWKKAEAARDESGGVIDKVTDEEIIEAYKILAGEIGVFVEPASAASVAGLIKLSKAGYFEEEGLKGKRKKIVCILTGHGLKDPERAIKCVSSPEAVEAKKENILRLMGY
ncbi:MAG: threonine synthase [Candidatus Omnitrophica bacterium]|nr:threonine synthase [Candidatus Omnitrophota bacterium]